MAIRNNPLQGQYMLKGVELVRTGIREIAGELKFVRMDTGAEIRSVDPRNERFLTSRAVTSAASNLGYAVDMAQLDYNAQFAGLLQQQARFDGFHLTGDHIVHLLLTVGTPEKKARAYAEAQVKLLEASYGVNAGTAAA